MIEIGIALLGILFSSLFAGTEAAYTIFNRLRLEIWKRQNAKFLKPLLHFQKKPEDFFSTILFGNNVSNILTTTFATVFLIRYMGEGSSWLIITLMILVFGEIIPKSLFRLMVNRVIRPATALVYGFYVVFSPFIKFINFLVDIFLSLFHVQHQSPHFFFSRDELELLLKEEFSKGDYNKTEIKYIDKILDFGTIKVREAMTPRTEIIAAPENISIKELQNLFVQHSVMHIPIYGNDLDDIKGIVFLYDLFKAPRSVKQILKPLKMVPETLSCAQLMREFKRDNISVALVVDEYGGTAGLVTMDDLIDTMFGDFPEAFDDVPKIKALNNHTWLLDGDYPLDELAEKVGLQFPEGEYETIAGLLLQHLGRIPRVDETVRFEHFRVVVTRATNRKILEVKLIKNLEP